MVINTPNNIANAAKALGWMVMEVQATLCSDEYKVLVKRPGLPVERAYSTHKFADSCNSFYYGHYDMSLSQAMKSMEER